MTQSVPQEVLRKVRKLARLPQEVRQSRWAVSITRLTTLKSLCREAEVANRFVTYLARKTLERVKQGRGRSAHPNTPEQRAHRQMMTEALAEMEAWMRRPTDERRQRLWDLLGKIRDEQNEYQNIKWGAVRNIHDWDLLLFEYALHGLLNPEREAGYWAYQTARHYAERGDSQHGSGLIPVSAPLVQHIADFWMQELNLDLESVAAPTGARKATKEKPPSTRASKGSAMHQKHPRFTHRQGQFLAFIHLYRKLHRQGPAELDMVKFFRVTPPSVHGMVIKLQERGLVTREPGVAQSIRVAIPEEEIPPLEDVEGPPS